MDHTQREDNTKNIGIYYINMPSTRRNRQTRKSVGGRNRVEGRKSVGGYNIYADAKRISKIKSKSRTRSATRSHHTK